MTNDIPYNSMTSEKVNKGLQCGMVFEVEVGVRFVKNHCLP